VKIIIAYDNEANPGFRSGWGFSCLVEGEKRVLFDTGGDGAILLYNMAALDAAPKSVHKVVISHNHWDHTGGLSAILRKNSKIEIVYPTSFSDIAEICPGIYSTGTLGTIIKEQSLVVSTERGNLVVTGCAHPGLVTIIEKSRSLGKLHGIVGGFHGFSSLEKLKGFELIAPCHCTKHKQEIREKYPEQFKTVKAGSAIKI
jgi:7,8-dihydropterin-6-yl-methyl-4-(beta-D-ribofuranosyl)aminobenzene 5'-phosphate synthase